MNPNPIFFRVENSLRQVDVNDILWLESNGNYVKVKTKEGFFMVRITLETLLRQLPEDMFSQTHRSFGISIQHLETITREYVTIANYPDDQIPIIRKYYLELIDKIIILEPTIEPWNPVDDSQV